MYENTCTKCGSINTSEIKMFDSPHYAKIVCNDCNSFVKWIPKPGINHKKRCKEQLSRAIAQNPENKFYQSLQKYFDEHGTLTPNQFKAINKF